MYLKVLLSAALVILVSGCGDSSDASNNAIAVTASDSSCDIGTSTVSVGKQTFKVQNVGSEVTEFYVYDEGHNVVGEVEDIGPATSRSLKVELTAPGNYEVACKPGMTGDGIRQKLTVT